MIRKIIIAFMVLALLGGCQQDKIELTTSAENSQSMNNFFAETAGTYAKGEHFQVKLMPVYRTESDGCTYYSYQLLIAPRYDEKLDIGTITVKANSELDTYEAKGMNHGVFQILRTTLLMDWTPVWDARNKLQCIRCDFVFKNGSDWFQQEEEISSEQFDELMRTVEITIEYNLINKETITVTGDEVLTMDARTAKETGRDDLYGLAMFGEFLTVYSGVYDGEFYPVGKVQRVFRQEGIWKKAIVLMNEKYGHQPDRYIAGPYYFYDYTRGSDNSTRAYATGTDGYFLFNGDELAGLYVSNQTLGDEYYDISEMDGFAETVQNKKYFQLLEQLNGRARMIWTPGKIITLKNESDVSFDHYYDGMFPEEGETDNTELAWKDIYLHRHPLNLPY